MAIFPVLRTGAAAQYPLEQSTRFRTQAVRFLDGSRQRFALQGAGLRRWRIELDLLDAGELAGVVAFAEQQGNAPFAFADPLTGNTVARCIIANDVLDTSMVGESAGRVSAIIQEIP